MDGLSIALSTYALTILISFTIALFVWFGSISMSFLTSTKKAPIASPRFTKTHLPTHDADAAIAIAITLAKKTEALLDGASEEY